MKVYVKKGTTVQQDLDGEAIKNLYIADNLKFEITKGNRIIMEECIKCIYKGKIYEKAQHVNWLDTAQYEKIKTRLAERTHNVQQLQQNQTDILSSHHQNNSTQR